MQTTCSNCGRRLTAEQLAMALDEAGVTTNDAEGITFCCSSYTDDDGCQGNDEDDAAYWYTR